MPEGPRTIHIFMNFLQCYSLWRTVFEPNHCEYRVDLLNWHEHSRPTFKMPAPRLFCICFEHNDRIQTFLGRRTICLSSRMTCLSSRISGNCCSRNLPTVEIFPPIGNRQAYGPGASEGFDIPIAEMDEPIWQTKLPPQLSNWCKLARCTNYQISQGDIGPLIFRLGQENSRLFLLVWELQVLDGEIPFFPVLDGEKAIFCALNWLLIRFI